MSEKIAPKPKKIFAVILSVIMYIFLGICILALVLSLGIKKDSDGSANIFGLEMRVVQTSSMDSSPLTDVSGFKIKSIPAGAMVVTKTVPKDPEAALEFYSKLEVGDVLTFKYVIANSQETITHRIIDIEPKEGGYIIQLMGDNKTEGSELTVQRIDTTDLASPNYVIGKVVTKSVLFGGVLTALKSPVGIVCIIIVPAFIIMILEIIKLVGILNEKKRRQALELAEAKENELEELRQRLAALERQGVELDERLANSENIGEAESTQE